MHINWVAIRQDTDSRDWDDARGRCMFWEARTYAITCTLPCVAGPAG